jgi:hypothetical protein
MSIATLSCITAVFLAGCQSKTEPSPTVSDLVIAGPNTLPIAQTAGYTATVTYSDGSSSAVSAAWTSSLPAVAEISAGGQLTAWTAGDTTLSANHEGRTATMAIRVTNPLVGKWVLASASNPGNPSGIGTRTKTFTETEWSITQPHPATGAIVFHHGGHYTLRGTEYRETVDFANQSTASLIGRTFIFAVNVFPDRFTQAGTATAPITEEWNRVPQ